MTPRWVTTGRQLIAASFHLTLGAAIISIGWYGAVWLIYGIADIASSRLTVAVVYSVPVVMLLVVMFGVSQEIQKIQAQRRNEHVSQALDALRFAPGGKELAAYSVDELLDKVKLTGVKKEDAVRLVEQGKQRLLIDDESFRTELSTLIVEYLQPLPRNAKRVMNRFRFNLLIAERRGLFTGPTPITRQQIGKWLVLGERWPLLRLSLSAVPGQMKALEQACLDRPPSVEASEFSRLLDQLAAIYAGDEDLREFIQSMPQLGDVLPLLVHYGSDGVRPPAA